MGFNMKRQQITSKEKSDKGFSVNGVKVVIEPGNNNWITIDQLKHLTEHSSGFNHFLKRDKFIVETSENAVREETENEKKFRLSLLDRAKSLVNRMKPQAKADDQQPLDTKADLEAFQKSLKTESATELDLFKDALRASSTETEKEFAESIDKLVLTAETEFTQFIKDSVAKSRKVQDKSIDDFSKTLDELRVQKLKIFKQQLTVALKAAPK